MTKRFKRNAVMLRDRARMIRARVAIKKARTLKYKQRYYGDRAIPKPLRSRTAIPRYVRDGNIITLVPEPLGSGAFPLTKYPKGQPRCNPSVLEAYSPLEVQQ